MSQITTPAVRGVPAFFVRAWMTGKLTVLGCVLGVFGVVDLFYALINFGAGDLLAVLANLVPGVVGVAAAAVVLSVWKPDAEMLDRVSTACMVAMWVTGAWAAFTLVGMIAFQGIFVLVGVALAIAFMMVLGSAASVVKAMAMRAS